MDIWIVDAANRGYGSHEVCGNGGLVGELISKRRRGRTRDIRVRGWNIANNHSGSVVALYKPPLWL